MIEQQQEQIAKLSLMLEQTRSENMELRIRLMNRSAAGSSGRSSLSVSTISPSGCIPNV